MPRDSSYVDRAYLHAYVPDPYCTNAVVEGAIVNGVSWVYLLRTQVVSSVARTTYVWCNGTLHEHRRCQSSVEENDLQ